VSVAELREGFVLPFAKRRKETSRSVEVSLEGIGELVADELLGPAARTALRCIEERGADPRLMLLVLESAQEGFFAPVSEQEYEAQRYARNGHKNGKGK
jgi:hypothetical protein